VRGTSRRCWDLCVAGALADKDALHSPPSQILTRTADGDEGGRHHLIQSAVSNGAVYTVHIQSGDKRWFKGQDKECKGSLDSFQVA